MLPAHRGDVVTLSGTTGAGANMAVETLDPFAYAGWRFGSDGTVDKYTEDGGYVQFAAATEWVQPNTHQNGPYWIRATLDTGDADNWVSSDATGSWLALTSDREWRWTVSLGDREGTYKIEIATDATGTRIVATGYYGGEVHST